MKFKLINPLQGSKIVIEGMKQKAGKTLLAVTMCVAYAKKNPDVIIYGNMAIKHPNYTQKQTIKQSDFKKNKLYILLIDELDLEYSWQDAHYNEGIWAFWGRGSSHNKCAMVCTIQNEYAQMRNTLRRTCHILVHRPVVNQETQKPYSVLCDVLYSEYGITGEFNQNIEKALGLYDPYAIADMKINFLSWSSRRIRPENIQKEKRSKLFCKSCGKEWVPKTRHPVSCPKCKTSFGYEVIKA